MQSHLLSQMFHFKNVKLLTIVLILLEVNVRVCVLLSRHHYENMPIQYTEIFKVVKTENFQ